MPDDDPLPRRLARAHRKLERGEELTDAEVEQLQADIRAVNNACETLVDGLTSALEPLMQNIAEAADAIGETYHGTELVVEIGDDGSADADPREQRLPKRVREARERKRQQREANEHELGAERYGGGDV